MLLQWAVLGLGLATHPQAWQGVSPAAANAAFLRIGLWETTAYAVICAVTLTKSLYVADSFPARRWVETKQLRELSFTAAEKLVALAGVLCLIGAALAEAFR